jgi:hypothetical protein
MKDGVKILSIDLKRIDEYSVYETDRHRNEIGETHF